MGYNPPEAVKNIERDKRWLFTCMSLDPKTRAERGFHPGGAGAPAHAFRSKDPTFNSSQLPLSKRTPRATAKETFSPLQSA